MTLRHSIHILLIAAAVLTAAGTAHAQKRGSAKSVRTERQRTQKDVDAFEIREVNTGTPFYESIMREGVKIA